MKSIITIALTGISILLLAGQCGGPPPSSLPAIVSVSPQNKSDGIRKETNIVIEFNNPMDSQSVEAAYKSNTDGIKANQVTFSWNNEKTILTINPKKDLKYAKEINKDTGLPNFPFRYSYRILKTATDTAGKSLNQDYDFLFSTFRYRTKYTIYSSIDADVRSDGLVGGCSGNDQQNIAMCVGESGLKGHPFYRSFVSFDISGLPADIVVLRADIGVYQFKIDGKPYQKHGEVVLEHINFGPKIDKNDFNSKVLTSLGKFGNNSVPVLFYKPVTKALLYDLKHRKDNSNRSQYRLRLDDEKATGSGNVIYYYTSDSKKQYQRPVMVISDLIP